MVVKAGTKPKTITDLAIGGNPKEDNFLVYSDSGVGKTVLAGSAAKGLIIAADAGTMSAARRGSTSQVAMIDDWKDFEDCQKWLRAGGWREYDWVVPDGLTMLWEKAMNMVMRRVVEENESRDPYIPAQGDHLKVHMMMKRTVEAFVELPTRVLFTALPMNIETQEGEEIVVPQVRGQKGDVSQYICGLMSAYGRMSLVKPKGSETQVRRIRWGPNGAYTGKDRYDGLFSPYTDDITLDEIAARIEGGAPTRTRRAAGTAGGATRRTRSTTTPARRRRTA